MTLDVSVLTGLAPQPAPDRLRDPSYVVVEADAADRLAYRRLRDEVFVREQELFAGTDADAVDDDPRAVVLVARSGDGEVLGGVRIHPASGPDGLPPARDLGWWRGSRLAVAADARLHLGVGAALVRAACARAEAEGALRFDAEIQAQHRRLFERLGWQVRAERLLHGRPHLLVDFPVTRIQRLADATKAPLGGLLTELAAGVPAGFLGDDGSPVPGSDLVAACDAILPAMVERDPEWAGWCSVLVNLNDLAAMGATPVGLLDAVGARDASFARRVLRGLTDAARAWGVPVLGGHTQLGVPGQLAVTALGRTTAPVPGGGGRAGQRLRLTADLGGGWRRGYTGAQWDSTSHRTPEQLRSQAHVVPALAPTAAKDVSMSGLVGTTGMLAEASGCRAVLDVAAIPTPAAAGTADWLTCFPGFAIVSAEDHPHAGDLPDHLDTAVCGELVPGTGVGLRWPDGTVTDAITHTVTGLGTAS
ncbi:AIR synthase [Nocardioides aromaticivorans]|uniref:AIR synthase n=1 Tax=Nocardioides aromaticivorans TaxID=200618 RepID=A0ABX7PPL5_9ACTN|nr:MSMEG_0567/sll0787 family protein [Nocardioides aromaticivorans]QSR27929.1 AIR synthase [Nocardioides aromaticivorans]